MNDDTPPFIRVIYFISSIIIKNNPTGAYVNRAYLSPGGVVVWFFLRLKLSPNSPLNRFDAATYPKLVPFLKGSVSRQVRHRLLYIIRKLFLKPLSADHFYLFLLKGYAAIYV